MGKVDLLKKIIGTNNSYRILNLFYMIQMRRISKELYNKWKSNSKYHMSHKGERCFILGNGPSLKGVDLASLSDEFVISVNNFSFVENYEKAKPNVHLWMDYSFFDLREDQKYDIKKTMYGYKLMSKVSPICFVPCVAYSFIKKNRLDDELDIHYLVTGKSFLDKKIGNIKLDKVLYSGTTVIHFAIQVAIAFGFKEIFLLGCDTTNIETIINTALEKQNNNMHAYEDDDTEQIYKGLLSKVNFTDIFYDQYMIFMGYKKLNEYCIKNRIRLKNCSSRTLLDEIDRISLSDVLNL